jgi:hypothetical protein
MKFRLTLAFAAAVVACAALGGSAVANRGHHAPHGQLYSFSGELLAAPGPNATSVSLQVETGNHAALTALVGQSQDQNFAVSSGTAVTIWSHGVPHVGDLGSLQQGDYVVLRIRAPHGSNLQQIEATAAAGVADHTTVGNGGGKPLWLFIGTVAGAQSGGHIALSVDSGNWKALHAMLGQSLAQTFTYDDGTIFLLWQGRVPTVIDASQLKAGDKITIRIRAPRVDSLAQVEATPAVHVGDHEPAPAPEE